MKARLARLALAMAAAATFVGGLTATAAPAPAVTGPRMGGWWICVANRQVNVEYCQGDPIALNGPLVII